MSRRRVITVIGGGRGQRVSEKEKVQRCKPFVGGLPMVRVKTCVQDVGSEKSEIDGRA
jgi:hypothetical protein